MWRHLLNKSGNLYVNKQNEDKKIILGRINTAIVTLLFLKEILWSYSFRNLILFYLSAIISWHFIILIIFCLIFWLKLLFDLIFEALFCTEIKFHIMYLDLKSQIDMLYKLNWNILKFLLIQFFSLLFNVNCFKHLNLVQYVSLLNIVV